ncbi:MAG: RNA polymerase sigma factor [Planctomycetota bacterium]
MEDGEAIARVKAGHADSFRFLVDRHKERVYRLVREFIYDQHEAEDVAQEAFVRAFRHLRLFEDGKPFLPWILTIARNLAINHGKKRRVALLAARDEHLSSDKHESPGQASEVREIALRIQSAAARLPERYRVAFDLFYREELSVKDIADQLGVPEGTVKSDLFRARALIRRSVELKNVEA